MKNLIHIAMANGITVNQMETKDPIWSEGDIVEFDLTTLWFKQTTNYNKKLSDNPEGFFCA